MIRSLIFTGSIIPLLLTGASARAQDTTFRFSDSLYKSLTTYTFPSITGVIYSASFYPSYYLDQKPEAAHRRQYRRFRHLIYRQPTAKTRETYFSLACSLWELNKLKEAETMFLKILRSRRWYYCNPLYYASDVPGDRGSIYGYGSYTYNYKNGACKYLAKICLKRRQSGRALSYVNMAVNTHRTIYTCGTGYNMQKQEYDFYYVRCYAGLNRHRDVLRMRLPDCFGNIDSVLEHSIRQLYSTESIAGQLDSAVQLLQFTPNKRATEYYTTRTVKGVERSSTIRFHTGKARIKIFGHTLELPQPPDPKNGQRFTKKYFQDWLMETELYKTLKEEQKSDAETAG